MSPVKNCEATVCLITALWFILDAQFFPLDPSCLGSSNGLSSLNNGRQNAHALNGCS